MDRTLDKIEGTFEDMVPVQRVILSVFDKTGLTDFARALLDMDCKLIATGGTAKVLREKFGDRIMELSDFTGAPEILDGRVKTLHPKIHGGLLSVSGNPQHMLECPDKIDMVVANLYPFEKALKKDADYDTQMENIDIGGPCMLRAASKNHARVACVSSPSQYSEIIEMMLENKNCLSFKTRQNLASEAFTQVASYDSVVSGFFRQFSRTSDRNTLTFQQVEALKYGANPHQIPACVSELPPNQCPFQILNGKPGYINLLDALNSWQLVKEIRSSIGVVAAASFKHVSPAGVGIALPLTDEEREVFGVKDDSLSDAAIAYLRARESDPMCSFGDFCALSDNVDEVTALYLKNLSVTVLLHPDTRRPPYESCLKRRVETLLSCKWIPHINHRLWNTGRFLGWDCLRRGTILCSPRLI
jgi:phosphoribosylaminoimidazolecarboxamide formyltransferase/IMP cyclohydrolase